MAVIIGKNGEDIDPVVAREAIENGMCPFCGAGPFRSVLTHTTGGHKVSAEDVLNMLGINRGELGVNPSGELFGRQARRFKETEELVRTVAAWRGYVAAGFATRDVATLIGKDYGFPYFLIQDGMGKAVGLGLIGEDEIPAWKNKRYRRNIALYTAMRDADETHITNGESPDLLREKLELLSRILNEDLRQKLEILGREKEDQQCTLNRLQQILEAATQKADPVVIREAHNDVIRGRYAALI